MFLFDMLCILAVLGAAWALALGWAFTAVSTLLIVLVCICIVAWYNVSYMKH